MALAGQWETTGSRGRPVEFHGKSVGDYGRLVEGMGFSGMSWGFSGMSVDESELKRMIVDENG